MYNMNNSIDGIDFARYSSSTLDGIDFNKYNSTTIFADQPNTASGITGTWTGIPVQVVETNPNDVVLCEVSNDIGLEECEAIHKELTKAFPNNTILLINGNIIKNFTFLRPKEELTTIDSAINTRLDYMDYRLDSIESIERPYGINDILY